MNKRLLVLSIDEYYRGVILVYDIENDVLKGINTPTPIITYNTYTLDPAKILFLNLTSF